MGYTGSTEIIFLLLCLLTFSAEPTTEDIDNYSTIKTVQPTLKHLLLRNISSQLLMQPGFSAHRTEGHKGSKYYISSADMSKIGCPYGTVPILTSYNSSMRATHFNKKIAHKDNGNNGGYGHSSISVWEPDLGTGRPPRYTGAVVEVQNEGIRIGTGWYVDPDMYGDNHAHFEIGWTDNDKSCTNLRCEGFVQLSTRIVPGAVLKPVSKITGKQYLMMVSIFKLFTNMSGSANMIGWMGVSNAASGEPYPPMGSGQPAAEGEGRAVFFTDVKVIDASMEYVSPYLTEIFTSMISPDCYRVGTPSTDDMGLHFYFGGAGCSPSH
uniref:Neprosin PEP catalytic domain-containing protein n=1 Tax=Oryza brachyantha TaxID=4533 RepID=J3N7I0_ORYBR